MKREFQVFIEKDSEGWLIADVPAFKVLPYSSKIL